MLPDSLNIPRSGFMQVRFFTMAQPRMIRKTMPLFPSFCFALSNSLNRITHVTGIAVAWLLPVMVGLTSLIVLQRLLFDSGSIALQEAVTYFHATVIMLAGAFTLGVDGHVRVDIFYRKMKPVQRAWVDVLGCLLFLLPLAVLCVALSYEYVLAAWKIREGSADAGGIGGVFLLKTLIVINGALLIIQALAGLLKNLVTLTYCDD